MSLNRHTMLILMLAGSVGLPYLSSTELGQKASRAMESSEQPKSGVRSSDTSTSSSPHSQPTAAPGSADSFSYSSSPSYSGYSATDSRAGFTADSTAGSTAPAAAAAATPAQAVSVTSSAVATGSMAAGADRLLADQSHQAASSPTSTGGSAPAKASTEPAKRTDDQPHTLAEVLRFDVTVPWIIANWPRVSAGLSELDLHGYRVPLVTGTGESDLAGSLTYYFNKKQQLDRIIFHGTGGDPRPLITLVTTDFELKRVIVNDPGLAFYQRKSWGRSHSELLIRPARVLRADVPNKRYEIEMAIKRP